MEAVGVAEAKENLEELIARAARGEEVVIVDPVHGSATLRIVPQPAEAPLPRKKRQPGMYKGVFPRLPDELFAPLDEEELKLWYGDETWVYSSIPSRTSGGAVQTVVFRGARVRL